MLPGGMQVLPPSGNSNNQAKPAVISRSSLHKVETSASKKSEKAPSPDKEAEPIPMTKPELQALCRSLSSMLGAMQTPAGKHTSSIMALSEQVQAFSSACTTYAESLPPQKKFSFRDLLDRLQRVAESLRTTPGGAPRNYEHLLQDLEECIKDIKALLAR